MVRFSSKATAFISTSRASTSFGAFRSRLDHSARAHARVRIDPEAARGWWHGLRIMGSNIPGVLTAGTYYHKWDVFYDVSRPRANHRPGAGARDVTNG